MGNISADDIAKISGPCIKCQACVLKCPNGARYFDDPVMMSHKEMLEENYGSRSGENMWYL
jgi:ferredoxin